jgi:hypothetical protein
VQEYKGKAEDLEEADGNLHQIHLLSTILFRTVSTGPTNAPTAAVMTKVKIVS